MKTPIITLAALVFFAAGIQAQQAATSQPTAASATPCTKPAPSQPRKQGWLELKARALACKKKPQFCNLPSSPDDALGMTPNNNPCPANTARGAAPGSKSLPQMPPAAPSPAPGDKPAYVCPPKTVLIPNTAYCLAADHTTVDAIPLPASLAAPTPAPKTPVPATPQQ